MESIFNRDKNRSAWQILTIFCLFVGICSCFLSFSSDVLAKTPKPSQSSRAKTLLRDAIQFWHPKIRFVMRANREYWRPKMRSLLRTSRAFWIPKIQFVSRANREFWVPQIEKKYLPYVRKRYRYLALRYGHSWARRYGKVMQRLRPAWAFPKFLLKESMRSLSPGTRHSIKHVPVPVKKAFDQYLSWSLHHLHKRLAKNKSLPKTLRDNIEQLANAMVHSRDKKLIHRINRAFRRVRWQGSDRGMRGCLRVIVLHSALINAFNTGCTSYITSGLAKKLTDPELSAVLAHEISHGDQGHAVKNIGLVAKSAGQHAFRLIAEEIEWFLTGKWGPTLQNVVQKGNLTPMLQVYGKRAPQVEIEADQGATEILMRAGISPKHLIHALMKLHGKRPNQKLDKQLENNTKSIRHYPSLYKRVQAILRIWKAKK